MNPSRPLLAATMVAALALVSGFQPAADAAPLTVGHIFGHVITVTDPLNLVAGSIAVGDPVLASIRYDPAFGVDSDPGDPTHGAYGSPGWIIFGINGLLFGVTSGELLEMTDTPGEDDFTILALSNPSAWPAGLPTFTGTTLSLTFQQKPALPPPLSLLSSDAPPPSLSFLDVPFAGFGLIGARNSSDVLQYSIEFQVDRIPEPPIGALGMVAISLWWWRRATSARRRG